MISPNWDEEDEFLSNQNQIENPLNCFWMEGDSLAPPCQSDMEIVNAILETANPSDRDHLMDIGCGDGRIPIEASLKYNCKSTGVEIEENLVNIFRKRIARMNIEDKVTALHCDLRSIDFNIATILIIYLLPEAIEEIKDKLLEYVKKNKIIICNTWGPKGWIYKSKTICGFSNNVTVYLYDHTSIP